MYFGLLHSPLHPFMVSLSTEMVQSDLGIHRGAIPRSPADNSIRGLAGNTGSASQKAPAGLLRCGKFTNCLLAAQKTSQTPPKVTFGRSSEALQRRVCGMRWVRSVDNESRQYLFSQVEECQSAGCAVLSSLLCSLQCSTAALGATAFHSRVAHLTA